MKPAPEEWESLRLAAKAADRMKAAEQFRADFEKRLRGLRVGLEQGMTTPSLLPLPRPAVDP
jgi:hypothetical protein